MSHVFFIFVIFYLWNIISSYRPSTNTLNNDRTRGRFFTQTLSMWAKKSSWNVEVNGAIISLRRCRGRESVKVTEAFDVTWKTNAVKRKIVAIYTKHWPFKFPLTDKKIFNQLIINSRCKLFSLHSSKMDGFNSLNDLSFRCLVFFLTHIVISEYIFHERGM